MCKAPEEPDGHAGVPPQPMNFSSYINGEGVRNQDLVNWVTLGAFDVPTSESAPLTSINGRSLSFWLLPYNYFDQVHYCLAPILCQARVLCTVGSFRVWKTDTLEL